MGTLFVPRPLAAATPFEDFTASPPEEPAPTRIMHETAMLDVSPEAMSEAVSASLRIPEILALLEECCCRLMKVRRAKVFLAAPALGYPGAGLRGLPGARGESTWPRGYGVHYDGKAL